MTQKELIEQGYTLENVKITSVDLSMEDHGVLVLSMVLEGASWGCVYGNYVLGHGYVGADHFDGDPKGIECIERIMDIVGVGRFNNMTGKYIRVATKGWGGTIDIIGNIISDKWFSAKEFYSKENDTKGSKE